MLIVDGLPRVTYIVTFSTPGEEIQGSSELSIILLAWLIGVLAVLEASATAPLEEEATLS